MPALRVFVSHTSELDRFPLPERSFIRTTLEAIRMAGYAANQMRDFTASPDPAARVCEGAVGSCELYLGVIGHRYGTPVREDPRVSYTELEYRTARRLGKRIVLFLLKEAPDLDREGVGHDPELVRDPAHGARQAGFRRRLAADHTVVYFSTPQNLHTAVLHTLLSTGAPAVDDELTLRQECVLDPYNGAKRREYLRRRTRVGRRLDERQPLPVLLKAGSVSFATPGRIGMVGGYLTGGGTSFVVLLGMPSISTPSHSPTIVTVVLCWMLATAVGAGLFVAFQDESDAIDKRDSIHQLLRGAVEYCLGRLSWNAAEVRRLNQGYFLKIFRLGAILRHSYACMGWGLVLAALAGLGFLAGLGGAVGAALGSGIGTVAGWLGHGRRRRDVANLWRQLGGDLGPLPPDCPLDSSQAQNLLLR